MCTSARMNFPSQIKPDLRALKVRRLLPEHAAPAAVQPAVVSRLHDDHERRGASAHSARLSACGRSRRARASSPHTSRVDWPLKRLGRSRHRQCEFVTRSRTDFRRIQCRSAGLSTAARRSRGSSVTIALIQRDALDARAPSGLADAGAEIAALFCSAE
jgi:hypothetical protein